MAIEFLCPSCAFTYKAHETQAGKTIMCRKCKATLIVPPPVAIAILPRQRTPFGEKLVGCLAGVALGLAVLLILGRIIILRL